MTDTVTTAPQPINMTPEYRAELKTLRKRGRDLARLAAGLTRDTEKEVKRIVREAEKQMENIRKEIAEIDKRRLIVAGRISK